MLPTPPEGLRHWRPADADALAAAWADPDIARWNPPPAGLDPAAWIAGVEERWTRHLALDLVIVAPVGEHADDVAGEVGLSSFTRAPARAELGVWVAAAHRRRGVARRAVATVTAWALTDLGLDQLWARTDPANGPAEALFAALGWDRLGEADGNTIWSATPVVLR
ncbi:MAG TPA: GNAT family N-acetyltransferase [Acidimicrobiales bacterium]|nr:GNAT family N-acetyltransferase [Acidimicrobiales bacterium]